MTKLERVVGNIFAAVLIIIVIFSIAHTLFTFVFRDARGMSPYGSRGEFYMAE